MSSKIRFSIIEGPNQGTFVLAKPIAAVTIGRSHDCKVAIADPSMSRSHFSLSWDGQQCKLADMNTTNGTIVNGSKVKEIILQNGDTIIAGNSIFKVDLLKEAKTAAANDVEQKHSLNNLPSYIRLKPLAIFKHIAVTHKVIEDKFSHKLKKESLLGKLAQIIHGDEKSHWYAIIDGSKAASLAYQAKAMGYSVYTLFTGESAQDFDLASAGPCVVDLDKTRPFLEYWINSMGDSAGILLQTDADVDIDSLYAHLRNIFIAQDEKEQDYFFRYYDPRVFNAFLPTCTDAELLEFFGMIDQWIVEDQTVKQYFSYKILKDKLQINNFKII